jgi:hypothetical protein
MKKKLRTVKTLKLWQMIGMVKRVILEKQIKITQRKKEKEKKETNSTNIMYNKFYNNYFLSDICSRVQE